MRLKEELHDKFEGTIATHEAWKPIMQSELAQRGPRRLPAAGAVRGDPRFGWARTVGGRAVRQGNGGKLVQPAQYAMIPGLGGHMQPMDEQSAEAMAASWYSARAPGGGNDVNSVGAILPFQGHPHPSDLCMSSRTGSQSSSIAMQVGADTDAVTEYIAMDGSKKRGRNKSKYRGATRKT